MNPSANPYFDVNEYVSQFCDYYKINNKPFEVILSEYLLAEAGVTWPHSSVFSTDEASPEKLDIRFSPIQNGGVLHEPADERQPVDVKEHAWRSFLDPLKGHILFYVRHEDDLTRMKPILYCLNRAVTLLCDFDVQDDVLPYWVQVVELGFSEEKVYKDRLLENSFPGLYDYYNAFACILEITVPSAIVLAGDAGYRGKVLGCLAVGKQIPLIALAKDHVHNHIYEFLPESHPVDTEQLQSVWSSVVASGTSDKSWGDLLQVCRLINEYAPLSYFTTAASSGLHIGCSYFLMDGWLNVDINTEAGALFMDAGKNFPFPDEAFRYVFSEHLFEHLNYAAAKNMLREAYRVLQPGGVFRLTMPCLEFLMDLYADPQSEVHRKYIDWSISTFAPEIKEDFSGREIPAMFVINNFMRFWGHQMIYDKETITYLLEQAGFTRITYPSIGESECRYLTGLEKHGDAIPGWANVLETFVIEAQK